MKSLQEMQNLFGTSVEFIDEGDLQYYWKRSPNQSAGGLNPKGICLHLTGGNIDRAREGQAAVNWFSNSNSGVSADYVVFEDGTIVCTVDRDNGYWAWANGVDFSNYKYTKNSPEIAQIIKDNWGVNPNTYLISIEVAGNAGEKYLDAQIQAITKIALREYKHWGIVPSRQNIVGHFEISPDIRANCPGRENVDTIARAVENAWNNQGVVTPVLPSVNTELQELRNQLENYKRHYDEASKLLDEQKVQIESLTSSNVYLNDRVVTLENDKKRLQDNIVSLQNQINSIVIPNDLSGEVIRLNTEVEKITAINKELEVQVAKCAEEKKTLSGKLQSVTSHLLPASAVGIIVTYALSQFNLPVEVMSAIQSLVVLSVNMLTVYLKNSDKKIVEIVK